MESTIRTSIYPISGTRAGSGSKQPGPASSDHPRSLIDTEEEAG